jgi:alpha-L-fucosidase
MYFRWNLLSTEKYLTMKRVYFACITGILLTIFLQVNAQDVKTHEEALKWFQNARFGLFIHWDMSSVAGTEISWSRGGTRPLDITGDPAGYVEDSNYDNLYKRFNPIKFNAEQWVLIARKAGMKYIVFTAKHHGGFCMWDTKYTQYSIMHTAFGRDIVKELSDACHKAGLGFGIYYSPRDWHNPDYGIGDNRKYIDYMNGQLRELLTNYGKVDILWWDSYGKGDLTSFWHIDETYHLVKELQPEIIMNNRMAELGNYDQQPIAFRGDWNTPEQSLGNFQNTRPWESCMTLVETPDGGGWSFRKDGKLRSYQNCLHALISCATGDGNLLLDAGPDSTGKIPQDQTERLSQLGSWLKKYGESIYGTRGGPYVNGDWGGATYKDRKIYLHIFKWAGNKILLPSLPLKILRYSNMTNSANRPELQQNQNQIVISLPENKQEDTDTIIVLETDQHIENIPIITQDEFQKAAQ